MAFLPLPVLRERAGVRVSFLLLQLQKDPHPNPLPEYREREQERNETLDALRGPDDHQRQCRGRLPGACHSGPGPTNLSQYPSPYPQQQQQPPWYGGPPQSAEDLRAPARRAGILMIVLGVLGVIAGLCLAFFSAFIGSGQYATDPNFREMQAQIQEIESKAGVSAQTIFLVMGIVPLAVGALMGGLGFFVRGGGLIPVVLAMVLDGLLVLMFVFFVLAGLIQGGASGNAQLLLGTVCMYGIPLVMVILLFFWLIQALRASSKIELARQQQQGQMWQYQQQQQAYRQPGGAGPASGQGMTPGQGRMQGTGWPTGPYAPPPPAAGGYHGYPGPQYPAAPPPPAAPSQSSPAVTPPPTDASSAPPADSGDRPDGPPRQG